VEGGRFGLEHTILGLARYMAKTQSKTGTLIDDAEEKLLDLCLVATATLPINSGVQGCFQRYPTIARGFRNSALFLSLRDSSQLKGKCGRCEFKEICGGSRARAYAASGDPLAEEPCCAYMPG
jgi:hypothetical protein